MPGHHALLDIGTHTLLTLSKIPAVVALLTEAIPHSYPQYLINYPTYLDDTFLNTMDSKEYPSWVWEAHAGRKFLKAPPEIQTDELRERSRLAVTKSHVARAMMSSITFMRTPVGTGIPFQETIYLHKAREAARLKEQNFEMTNPMEFPFVTQYADDTGMSIQEAVETILFEEAVDVQLLARTETLRVRYFNRLKKATTPHDTHRILDDFRRDTYLNGLV